MQHQSLVLCALVVAAMLMVTPASGQDATQAPTPPLPSAPMNSSAFPEPGGPAALVDLSAAAGNATTLTALKPEMDGVPAPGTPSGLSMATTTTTAVPANSSVLQPGSQANIKAFKLAPNITTVTKSQLGRRQFRMTYQEKGSNSSISPWHDIPIKLNETDGVLYMRVVVEIPKGETAKVETWTTEPHNPLHQVEEEVQSADNRTLYYKLRYYKYGPSLGNYGSVPQTWEDSELPDPLTQLPGDNDPLDFIDVGKAAAPVGAVYDVKVLGALGLIDANETDYKIIAINKYDPAAPDINSVADLPEDQRTALHDFFKYYKIAEGKAVNRFYMPKKGDEGAVWLNRTMTNQIIQHSHESYQRLLSKACITKKCKALWLPGMPGGAGRPAAETLAMMACMLTLLTVQLL